MSFRFAWTECVFHISQNWRQNCKREYSLKYEFTLSCATVLWGRVICCHLGAQSKPTHWSSWHSCAALTKVWLSPQHLTSRSSMWAAASGLNLEIVASCVTFLFVFLSLCPLSTTVSFWESTHEKVLILCLLEDHYLTKWIISRLLLYPTRALINISHSWPFQQL